MTHRLEITLSDELWDALNAARGFEPRASFVKRALEQALSRTAMDGAESATPTRAPVEKEPDGPAESSPAPGSARRGAGAEKAPRSPERVSVPSRPAHLQNFQRAGRLG